MIIWIQPARLDWRAVVVLAAAVIASFSILLWTAGPVAACSCAMPGSMKEYATVEHAVFTGKAGERIDRGVPVEVDQWLWGEGAADVVWLTAASFGDSAGCGTNPPPAGTSWIWVAWLPGNNGDFGTGLCSPHAQLDTPEGQTMLADALAVFDPNAPPPTTPEPTPAPQSPIEDPASGGRDASMLVIGGAVVLASLAMFGGVALVARRQNRGGGGV